MNVKEQMIVANGYEVFTKTTGAGDHAIFFFCGASVSLEMWQLQLTDIGLQNYQLIAVDTPGHGRSHKALNYRIKDMAKLVPALVKYFRIDSYILVGISYSTCLLAEAAPMLDNTCKGFFMAAPNMMNNEVLAADVFKANPDSYVIAAANPPLEDLWSFAQRVCYDKSSSMVDLYINDHLATDPLFRSTNAKIFESQDWSDELANLQQTGLPVCLVFGKEEEVMNTAYLDSYAPKWGNKIFLIENAGHFVNVDQPIVFNKLLLQFANEVFSIKF